MAKTVQDIVYDENVDHRWDTHYNYKQNHYVGQGELFDTPRDNRALPQPHTDDLPPLNVLERVAAWSSDEMEMVVGEIITVKNICGIWYYEIEPEDRRSDFFWSYNVIPF